MDAEEVINWNKAEGESRAGMDDREGFVDHYADSDDNRKFDVRLRKLNKLGQSCKQNAKMRSGTTSRLLLEDFTTSVMAYLPGTHEKRFITVERGRAKRDRAKRDDRGEDTWARVVMPGDNPDTRQKLPHS